MPQHHAMPQLRAVDPRTLEKALSDASMKDLVSYYDIRIKRI
jgi:hypothetical protein